MILSAARPYFCPHPGYFARILASDVFVVLDDVQFPLKTTWITRNRFKNDRGVYWVRVPVLKKGLGLQKIRGVKVCPDERWRRKVLEGLRHAYGNAPYYEDHAGALEEALSGPSDSLIDIDLSLIGYVLGETGISTRVVRMSETGVEPGGGPILVELCRKLGASRIAVQGSGARTPDLDACERAGIELVHLKPCTPVYPQLWGGFIPNLSVFDLLFNCGPRTSRYLGAGSPGKG
ncbi:MAG TPA: WbqC family protein [Deltaproteobacteria bacterium]|nr:WbqC family protein [Deltaproteobacteria bacterium]